MTEGANGIAPGTIAWVMTARGVIHRAQFRVFTQGADWVIACRDNARLADRRWHVVEQRPRDANMCRLCARVLGAARANPRQGALFGSGVIDGRE